MKTFTSMSTPDKKLTMLAYEQLSSFLEIVTESKSDLPSGVRDKLRLKNHRLQQLIEALAMELLSE
jgi:hypothetical protein